MANDQDSIWRRFVLPEQGEPDPDVGGLKERPQRAPSSFKPRVVKKPPAANDRGR